MRSDRPRLTLCSIDLERNAAICVRFCEDAIQGSFGSTDGNPTNPPAWRFYQRHGWQDLGPREDEPSVHLLHKDLAGVVLT